MVVLTDEMILAKTKAASISAISRILICSASLDDISSLSKAVNIENISMVNNLISDLEPLRGLTRLRELYLRRNKITESALPVLHSLPLTSLGLSENPICDIKDYRLRVLAACPKLLALDGEEVTPAERASANALLENGARPQQPTPRQQPAAAAQQQAAAQPSKPAGKSPSRKKIVYAILHLLDELDEESLRIVVAEARARIKIQSEEKKD